MYIVYGLFCDDEIFYIGKTTTARLIKRYNEHISRANNTDNQKIYNKIRKLLKSNKSIHLKTLFSFATSAEQNDKEVELISFYGIKHRNGGLLYNSTSGGEGCVGWKHTEESKKRMSSAKMGNKNNIGRERNDIRTLFSKEIYLYNTDGEFIMECKSSREAEKITGINYKRISSCLNGRKISKAFSDTLNCHLIFRDVKTPSIKAYIKPCKKGKEVIQYDKNMNEVASFRHSNEASRETNINALSIRNVCAGKQKTAGGYIWKYKIINT